MSNKVYGFCDAGCRYPVPTLDDFLNSAALGKIPLTDGKSDPLNPFQKYKIRSAKDTYGAFTGKPYLKVPAGNEFSIGATETDEYRTHYDFELIDYTIRTSTTPRTVVVVFEVNGQRFTNEIAIGGTSAIEPFTIVFKDCEELYVYNDGTNIYDRVYKDIYKHRIAVNKPPMQGGTLSSFGVDCIVYSSSNTPITADTFKDEYLIGARLEMYNPDDEEGHNYPILRIAFNETTKNFYIYYLASRNEYGASANVITIPANVVTITDTVTEV